MPFMFTVGESYRTQEGYAVQVVGRHSTLRGYETVLGDDGRHRYDRSDSDSDAGRCTGTAHDYSCPYNFARPSGVQTPPKRCADCDLPNGCPEFCWCDAAGAGKAEYASWFPIRPRGVREDHHG